MSALDRIGGEVLDSRDVIEALAELDAEDELDEDEIELRDALRALDEEAPGEDWIYGATMIREDYFEQYAQEFAEDIGAIDASASWPLSYIDWEAAATALAQDYSTVEFQGSTYYVR
jgi:antirestriction protein